MIDNKFSVLNLVCVEALLVHQITLYFKVQVQSTKFGSAVFFLNKIKKMVINLPTRYTKFSTLYAVLRYVCAAEKPGRPHAFFSKKSLLAPKKGARHAIKRIELYGVTWPFFGELLLIFCKTRWNVPYRSSPYKM